MNGQKNTKQKLLSLVLVVMMVLSTMVIMPLTASAEDTLIGGGDGKSAETAFKVATAADLSAVKTASESWTQGTAIYVELTADIAVASDFNLNGDIYAGANNAKIEWHFDGKGHTISGLKCELIGGLNEGSHVFQNLNLQGDVAANRRYTGMFVGLTYGSVTFINCTTNGSVRGCHSRTNSAYMTGGFVGDVEKPGSLTFTNCINNATVYVPDNRSTPTEAMTIYAGGFVAHLNNGTGSLSFTNCINAGNVTSVEQYAGGYVGFLADSASASATFTNCVNKGTVTAPNAAAGFVGFSKSAPVTLTNCYATGVNSSRALLGESSVAVDVSVTNDLSLEEILAKISEPQSATAGEAWDGATVTTPKLASLLDEDTTNDELENSADNPYIIMTAAELAYFSAHNANAPTTTYWAQLGANINLGGNPWKGLNSAATYTVNLDGANYTIANAHTSAYTRGFINTAYLVNLSNLHFSNIWNSSASSSQSGTIIGVIEHANANVTFTNVTTDALCRASADAGSGKVGGFVGRLAKGALTITNSINATSVVLPGVYNNADLTNKGMGGFLGYAAANTTVVIDSCVNYGGLAGQASGRKVTGAIIGLNESTACTVSNVYDGPVLANVFNNYQGSIVTNSYVGAEVSYAKNADAIAEIDKMGLSNAVVPSTVTVDGAAKRATRLKVTDDFGFMALADLTDDCYNPHVTYGMLVMAGTADADTLKADGTFVAGERYQDANIDNAFCVAYTDITVATMNQAYAYATAIMVNGEIVAVGTVYDINCYDWAQQLSDDGVLADGTVVTNVQREWQLYDAMVNYCDKYNLYLAKVNEQ